MIDPTTTPRIPYREWINSEHSQAGYSGRCEIRGVTYLVDRISGELVREDKFTEKLEERC